MWSVHVLGVARWWAGLVAYGCLALQGGRGKYMDNTREDQATCFNTQTHVERLHYRSLQQPTTSSWVQPLYRIILRHGVNTNLESATTILLDIPRRHDTNMWLRLRLQTHASLDLATCMKEDTSWIRRRHHPNPGTSREINELECSTTRSSEMSMEHIWRSMTQSEEGMWRAPTEFRLAALKSTSDKMPTKTPAVYHGK